MLARGFDSRWVDLVMECITSYSFLVLINDKAKGNIIPQRGLRQGGPLSLYLILICAEGLSPTIQIAHESSRISGISLAPSCPTISHIFFAYDNLIFCKATIPELYALKIILLDYEKASGQKVNFDKSALWFSTNVGDYFKNYMTSISGMKLVPHLRDYLGLPSSLSHSESSDFMKIKDRV